MRIIGEFDLDQIKVTVFKMNERISLKFEYNLLEQTYKFRDGSGISNMEDIRNYCSQNTMTHVQEIFKNMAESRSSALSSLINTSEDEFEIII